MATYVSSYYTITAVRINEGTNQIERVRWAKRVPESSNSYVEEAGIGEVLRALESKIDVQTAFPKGDDGFISGPKVLSNEKYGIQTVNPDANKGRTLYDLPRF